jgi:hypothetical protein
MKEHYDFINAKKNPYSEKINKHGYIIRIQHDGDDDAFDDSEEGKTA